MDCDVGLLNSEIDVPKTLTELNEDFYKQFSEENDSSSQINNMGVENTWNEEEVDVKFLSTPIIQDLPLTSTSNYEESLEGYVPFPVDLDGLFNQEDTENQVEEDTLLVAGRGEAGVCGLRNLGNTCFMSSGVQCLMATAPIVSTLLKSPIQPHHTLTVGLAELTKLIWSAKHGSIPPTHFKNSLASHFPQFNDYRQHDCQEFLALLLDGLHEQMNTALKSGSNKKHLDDCADGNNKKQLNFDDVSQSTSRSTLGTFNCKQSSSDIKDAFNNSNSLKCNKNKSLGITCSTPVEMNNSQGFLALRKDKNDGINYCDKQLNNASMLGEGCPLNNTLQRFSGLEDIVKDPRAANSKNVNVLITEEEINQLRFDSEKYSNIEMPIWGGESENSNSFHLYENNTGGKRCKTTVTHFSSAAELKEGLDLKRVKLNSNSDEVEEKNKKMEKERHKFTELLLDKNQRLERERKDNECDGKGEGEISSSGNNSTNLLFESSGEIEGDKHWQSHLSANRSIIVETFQGQFKSTVICSSCQFVSVTFEPFMYLSVPLPNAMQKLINVTFICDSQKEPTMYVLEMNRYDNIGALKDRLICKLDGETPGSVIIAEVLDHHITKLLDDNYLIRHLNDSDRHLYAFKIITLKENSKEVYTDLRGEDNLVDNRCIICLEDIQANMKQHEGCSCILCDSCIATSCQHSEGTLNCPVCQQKVLPENLCPIKVDKQMTTRMINVPLVFRIDTIGDGNNNQKSVKLFSHPKLLRLPNLCSSESLRETVANINPYSDPYRLLLVDGKGDHCSRCMFTSHCRGCEVVNEGQIMFQWGDSLAVTFSSPVDCSLESTLKEKEINEPATTLTLYDCIQSFSKSELLDGNNPWYCPHCRENRCATKTLSVWRYPDYLIVYLKRFVFHNRVSTKLEEKVMFPLRGLTLASCGFVYDLYACVCHIGGVSAGHYTTYTQHPYTGQWHFFNDSFVSKRCPQEEDYSNAYILFYKKQGIAVPALDTEETNNGLSSGT